MRTTVLLRASALAVAVAACGGGDDNPGTPDAPATTPDGPPVGPGGFRIDKSGGLALVEEYSTYAAFWDRAFEQPLPVAAATEGDCTVYRRALPQCPDGCGVEVCVADDTCAPRADRASAGEIEITGLTIPMTLVPAEFGYEFPPIIPPDLFADDAAIHVAAAGAEIPAFSVDLTGVPPLVTDVGLVELEDGQDETVTWTAAPGDARIQLALLTGWHGAPWTAMLLCETKDDGELVVPASLVEQMPYLGEVGLFQWPSWILRFHRVWVEAPVGSIEIMTGSQIGLGLTHLRPE
jgi:hypothetical protein